MGKRRWLGPATRGTFWVCAAPLLALVLIACGGSGSPNGSVAPGGHDAGDATGPFEGGAGPVDSGTTGDATGATVDASDSSAHEDASDSASAADTTGADTGTSADATEDTADAGVEASGGDASSMDATGNAPDSTAAPDASDAGGLPDASDGGGQPPAGQLYVLNAGPHNNDGAILRFVGPSTINGNAAPAATISGIGSTLLCPHFGYFDVPNDRMYVADPCAGAVDVFERVSTSNGSVAPARRIGGSATTFARGAPGNLAMMSVAVDTSRDVLYVSTSNQNGPVAEVAVFAGASTVNGNVAPTRIITTPAVPGQMLNFNHGVFSDAANDRLYVASLRDGSVLVFDVASTRSGSTTPTRWLSGASTGLTGNDPIFMQLDAAGDLIVDCRTSPQVPTSGIVEVFAAGHLASAVTGNIDVAPARAAITGPLTTLAGPHMIDYRQDTDELYVGNAFGGDVLVFSGFGTSSGNVAPSRTLSGPNTGLQIPAGATIPRTATGVMIDLTR